MNDTTRQQLDFALDLDFSDILTNPILDIAARFWEDDRYQAFRIFYRSMRSIDDLVDERKAHGGAIGPGEAAELRKRIVDWLSSMQRREPFDDFSQRFLTALDLFAVPLWPWERLARAMLYDLEHDGFPSVRSFLRYTEGAAIAPASIFMHLCGVSPDGERYRPPEYDIRRAARPLALFSYVIHIVRDFQKDLQNGLNYFPDTLLAACSLTVEDLSRIADGGPIPDSFRRLVGWYVRAAEYYRSRALFCLKELSPHLEGRYNLSLAVVYQLYSQVLERVDVESGTFRSEELQPTPGEIDHRLKSTITDFLPSAT